MATSRLSRYLAGAFALCLLSAIVLVGCGGSSTPSTSNSSSSANTTAATATACAQLRARVGGVTGTVQSVNGQTIHITANNGRSVDATYSSTTRITQQKLLTGSQGISALQQGAMVSIQVQPSANGSSYTATSITLGQGGQFGQGQNGAGAGNSQGRAGRGQGCFGGGQGRNRNGAGGAGQANGQSGRNRIFGTIGQVTGTTLTITDRQQNPYTIALASNTQIIETTPATASDIQAGMGIRVTGPNNNGVITASSIMIYAPGLLPTPTPGASNP